MDLFKPDLILKQLNKKCLMCNNYISIRNRIKSKYTDYYCLVDCLKCQLTIRFSDIFFQISNNFLFLYTEIEIDRIEIVSIKIDAFSGHPDFYMKMTLDQWIKSFKIFDLETSFKVLNRFSKNYMFM